MVDLFKHGRKVESVFQLLGERENDITFSLGWTLAHSACFLEGFIKDLFPKSRSIKPKNILLQEHSKGVEKQGITDIEVKADTLHCIIEAKKGWALPSDGQLRKYARRVEKHLPLKALVVLSECSTEYSANNLISEKDGIPVLSRN